MAQASAPSTARQTGRAPSNPRGAVGTAKASPRRASTARTESLSAQLRHAGARTFLAIFQAEPLARVRLIKDGVPPIFVDRMAEQMRMPKERLLPTLGLSTATVNRKKSEDKTLSTDESERVLGMARLVGQVESMVQQSGESAGFNAPQWVARWLQEPLPALGGQRPAEFMDTAEGQAIVANLVERMQSGAYA